MASSTIGESKTMEDGDVFSSTSRSTRIRRTAFAFLLLLSGFCGISYEILYGRMLGNIVGDQFAVSASILLTFLLGIGFGAVYAHRLWSFLWLIEAAIGLCGLAFAFGVDTLDRWLYATVPLLGAGIGTSIAICVLLLIVPAFLVGCSLPLFAGYLSHLKPGRVFARAYTVYNFGAAATVLVIEFVLVRMLGIRDAVVTIAALNGVVAVCLLTAFARPRGLPPALAERIRFPASHLAALALVSVASAVFQLLMVKSAEALLGPFRETFALVLSVVLFGIALGSALTERFRLTLSQVLAANLVGLLWLVGGFGVVAGLYAAYYPTASESYLYTVLLKLAAVALLMGLPATSFGATIPALLTAQKNVARESGQLLFVSSVANAFGFLLMALVLHRHLDYGILILVIAAMTAAGLLVFKQSLGRPAVGAMAALVAALGLHRWVWDENLLYLGHTAFHSQRELAKEKRRMDFPEKFKGYQDVFAINWIDGKPYFFVNGYISMSLTSPAEKLVGAFASLFAPRTDKALILGVGSGATAGTVGLLFEQTDGVELSTVVLDNLHRMAEYNFNVESMPGVNIVADDAIHYVKASREQYSLIVNTVTTPLYFSSSKLYTRDFLQTVRRRLTADGVYVTWVDSRVGDRGIDIMLKTLAQSFQDCWMGGVKASYYLLLCSQQKLAVHHPRLIAENPMLARYFAKEYDILPEWIVYGLLSADALSLLDDGAVPVNTLDRPTLEFEIARLRKRGIARFKRRLRAHMNLAHMESAIRPRREWDPVELLLHTEELYGEDATITNVWRRAARAAAPDFARTYDAVKLRYYASFARTTQTADAYHKYGFELLKRKRCTEAIEEFKRALERNPSRDNIHFNIGSCYEKVLGDYARALEHYAKEGEVDPEDNEVPLRIGRVNLKLERYDAALKAFDTAISRQGDWSKAHYYRGLALRGLGAHPEARRALQKALELDADNGEARAALEQLDAAAL